jgi:hypothetical protein
VSVAIAVFFVHLLSLEEEMAETRSDKLFESLFRHITPGIVLFAHWVSAERNHQSVKIYIYILANESPVLCIIYHKYPRKWCKKLYFHFF